jgi:hypothetical protein
MRTLAKQVNLFFLVGPAKLFLPVRKKVNADHI